MKKALSLFLALVVALVMIPLHSICAFAAPTDANNLLSVAGNAEAEAVTLTQNVDFTGVDVTGEQFLQLATAISGGRIATGGYALTGLKVLLENETQFLALNANMQGEFTLAKDLNLGGMTVESQKITLQNSTLNGAGHTVTGFSLEKPANQGICSLFAMNNAAGNQVVIRNISFGTADGMIGFTHQWGTRRIAVVMGEVPANTSCTMENVSVYVNMKDTGSGTSNKAVGGLVGWGYGDVILTGCNSYGAIDSWSQGGSAAGTAGLVGVASASVTLINCNNYATVTGAQKIGGMIGSALKQVTVINCANYGNVYTKSGANTGAQVGGLIGDTWNSNDSFANNFYIDNFVNYGDITGTTNVGGFIGEMHSNRKTVKGTLNFVNSRNCGSITTTGSGYPYAGGFIGQALIRDDLNFENCLNSGTVKSCLPGGFIGHLTVNYSLGQSVNFRDSANYGEIISTAANAVGGFVAGSSVTVDVSVNVENCANYGAVTGHNAGGFAGSWKQAGKLNVTSFLNTGALKGNSRAAAIVANAEDISTAITVTNSINLGECVGSNPSGAFIGVANSTGAVKVSGCVNAGNLSNKDVYAILYNVGTNAENSTSDNFCYGLSLAADRTNGATALNSWNEVLAKLNTETYTNAWGAFKFQTAAGTGIVQATPVLKGCQMSPVTAVGEKNVYSVRFVATIQNTLEYQEVGIRITAANGNPVTKKCAHVYKTVTASGNGGAQLAYSASELGGSYIYALTVENIPAEGTVVLTVQPYAVDANDAGTEYYGTAYTATFENGVLVSVVPANAN